MPPKKRSPRPPTAARATPRAPSRPTATHKSNGQARPLTTPGASPRRKAVELRSAKVLLFLSQQPKGFPLLVVIGLAAAGLLAGPAIGVPCLLLLASLLTWLLFLSWPALPPPGKAVRGLAVLVVLGAAITRLVTGS